MEAAMNLSVAMDQDLKSSTLMLGKALNDPIRGITALTRAGVSFSAAQIEVIKKLWETGEQAKAQQMILAELGTQFGGIARREAQTFTGRLTQLRNVIGDLAERIGDLLLPTFTRWVTAVREFVNTHGDQIVSVFSDIYTAVGKAVEKLKTFVGFIIEHGETFRSLAIWIGAAAAAIYTATAAMAAFNAVSKLNPVMLILSGIALLIGGVVALVDHLGGLKRTWIHVTGVAKRAWEEVRYVLHATAEEIRYVGDILKAIGETLGLVFDVGIESIKRFGSFMVDVFESIWELLKNPRKAGEIFEGLKTSLEQTIAKMGASVVMGVKDIWLPLSEDHELWMEIIRDRHMGKVEQIKRETAEALAALASAAAGGAGAGAGSVAGIAEEIEAQGPIITSTIRAWWDNMSFVGPADNPLYRMLGFNELESMLDWSEKKITDWAGIIQAAASGVWSEMQAQSAKVTKSMAFHQIQLGRLLVSSYREGLKAYLQSEGERMAFESLKEAAYAIASLVRGDFAGAAGHALASAKFAAIGTGAAIGASLVGGGGGGGGGGYEQRETGYGSTVYSPMGGGGGASASLVSAAGPVPQVANFNLNITYAGTTIYGEDGMREAFYQDILPLIEEAFGTRLLRPA